MFVLDYLNKTKSFKEYASIIKKDTYSLFAYNSVFNANIYLAYKAFLEGNETIFYICSNIYKATIAYETFVSLAGMDNVNYYVMDDFSSSEALATSSEYKYERMYTIDALIKGEKRIVVCNIAAILRYINPKIDIENHILNIKDDYTLRDSKTGIMETIKKGNNQKLSSAICEYIFRNFDPNTAIENTSIEQAYFLSPDKSLSKIIDLSQKIQIEHIRDSISQRIKTLHKIITHNAKGTNQNFQEVLSLFWCTFYDSETMSMLRDCKNINGSPLYYMKTNTLYFMNEILSKLEMTLYSKTMPSMDFVKNQVKIYAIKARNEFKKFNTTPEKHLLKTSFEETPKQVKNIRKRFWKENYPVIIR